MGSCEQRSWQALSASQSSVMEASRASAMGAFRLEQPASGPKICVYVGAASETVDVSVIVFVLLTGMTVTEGLTVSVTVVRSMNSAVVVGARPWKEVVVAAMKLVT